MEGLMLDSGSKIVGLSELRALPTPQQLGDRHAPIPHSLLVDTLREQILDRGWNIPSQQLGLSRKGARLFGTMKLEAPRLSNLDPKEMSPMLGFRSSTDSSLAVRFCVGAKVFVCENMMFEGDSYVLRRKSTTGLLNSVGMLDIQEMIARGLDQFMARQPQLEQTIAALKGNRMDMGIGAKARIFDIFDQAVLPKSCFEDVSELFFNPPAEYTDITPTLYGLNNACTRALQKLKQPVAQFEAANRVGSHFSKMVFLPDANRPEITH